ncbi:EAL domain-containing protein [Paenibacillus sp. OK003]|uniref:EAL domain-containing protein n=1 Tax=Paenibacillus sp. OK003 TaxID=1884380 RepID=UPI0008B1D71B|nr:EAL domain-containing protein [Paenibacillus sp. OK003]SEL20323.1 EAL domain, c-di-GMP-specific phosphodiesterase class I (or its enzymatically inactive variant) [Paenibacillus sp. OK003]
MNCSGCSPIHPIEDQGTLYMRPISPALLEALHMQGRHVEHSDELVWMHFLNLESAQQCIEDIRKIESTLPDKLTVQVAPLYGQADADSWISLSMQEARLNHADLVSVILEHQFSSHMQPIVDASEQIIGFEFLLRPAEQGRPFSAYELFEVARDTGLHSFLDRTARIAAIETSAVLLPHGVKRFVNFLPSSIYNPEYCLTHTFEAIERLSLDPKDFVFEVVETEQIQHMSILQHIFEVYRSHGMSVALDDVGAGFSTIEVMNRLEPDFVKIDRSLIDRCDHDLNKQQQIIDIVEMSRRFGGRVLAEGIERIEEFDFCRSVGIDLAQGYYFGKPTAYPPQGPYGKTSA